MAANPLAVGPGVPPPGDNVAFFQMVAPANNGLPGLDGDDGVGGVTGAPQDIGVFKSPSLRTYVVARINPVRFHRAKKGDAGPAMPMASALTRMSAAKIVPSALSVSLAN